MERLCRIKDTLIDQVQMQLNHLESVDAKELGEVIDMIKDIEEAVYYCTITEAMKEKDEWKHSSNTKMYYREEPSMKKVSMQDVWNPKEGKSHKNRKMYMESKEMHNDKNVHLKELENYMKELSSDIIEMIQGATPEEKQMLKTKMTTLVSKIDHA